MAAAEPAGRKITIRTVILIAAVVVVGLVLAATTQVQMRPDTGELRYCALWMPLRQKPLRGDVRRAIRHVTERGVPLRHEWHTVGVWWWGWPSERQGELSRYHYPRAAAWLSVAPSVSRLVFEDLAGYVERVGKHTMPDEGVPCRAALEPGALMVDQWGECYVRPGWRRDPALTAYLENRGWTPDARLPAPSPDAQAMDLGWSPLHEAAAARDHAKVEALLAAGADVNSPDGLQWTALHWAAAAGDEDLVRGFCAHGADVEAANLELYTPLHVAADGGHAAAVRELIAAGANLDAKAGDGFTPLMLAAASGAADVVVALLEAGADPEARDNGRAGAWYWLIAREDVELARLFLDRADTRHAIMPNDLNRALHLAAKAGNRELARLLLDAGAVPRAYLFGLDTTPLNTARVSGHSEIVQLFEERMPED